MEFGCMLRAFRFAAGGAARLCRCRTSAEIAGLAILLAPPAGGYFNGQAIAVDGAHTISFR
jgi:hypothetical protein